MLGDTCIECSHEGAKEKMPLRPVNHSLGLVALNLERVCSGPTTRVDRALSVTAQQEAECKRAPLAQLGKAVLRDALRVFLTVSGM